MNKHTKVKVVFKLAFAPLCKSSASKVPRRRWKVQQWRRLWMKTKNGEEKKTELHRLHQQRDVAHHKPYSFRKTYTLGKSKEWWLNVIGTSRCQFILIVVCRILPWSSPVSDEWSCWTTVTLSERKKKEKKEPFFSPLFQLCKTVGHQINGVVLGRNNSTHLQHMLQRTPIFGKQGCNGYASSGANRYFFNITKRILVQIWADNTVFFEVTYRFVMLHSVLNYNRACIQI